MSQIDFTYLNTAAENNKDIILKMCSMFKQQVPELILNIDNAYNNKNWIALSEAVHKAKSSIAILGMNEQSERLRHLEIMSKQSENINTYINYINEFKEKCAEALIELEKKMKEL